MSETNGKFATVVGVMLTVICQELPADIDAGFGLFVGNEAYVCENVHDVTQGRFAAAIPNVPDEASALNPTKYCVPCTTLGGVGKVHVTSPVLGLVTVLAEAITVVGYPPTLLNSVHLMLAVAATVHCNCTVPRVPLVGAVNCTYLLLLAARLEVERFV